MYLCPEVFLVPTTGGADGMCWWWEVSYSFYSSFFFFKHCMADGCWEYLFFSTSYHFIVYNSAVHGNDLPSTRRQIRWQSDWGGWCGLGDRRAARVPPATGRLDTTGREANNTMRTPAWICVFSVHPCFPSILFSKQVVVIIISSF